MAASSKQEAALQNALKSTRKLRSSVSELFEGLQDGSRGNEIINDMYQRLMGVSQCFSELDKTVASLSPQSIPPSNVSLLYLDPFLDRSQVYQQLDSAFKSSAKGFENALYGHKLLQQHSLKRTGYTTSAFLKRVKRPRHTTHAAVPQQVEQDLRKLTNLFPNLRFDIARPAETPVIMTVQVRPVLQAMFVMRGLWVESITVKGITEDFLNEEGQVDLWAKSRFKVFRMVTDHAQSMMLHFHSPSYPIPSLTSLLKWLESYKSLFTAPCVRCEKHLRDMLPPTWRDMTFTPYHVQCKQ